MKTLLVTSQFPPLVGGVPSVYENLCRHLGGTIAVLTQRPPAGPTCNSLWDEQQPYSIRRIQQFSSKVGHSLPTPLSWLVRYVGDNLLTRARVKAEFAEVLDDIRPDVVCLGTLHTNYWLAPVARARHIPVVFYIHGEEACGIRRSRLNGDGPKTALLQANSCIAVSRFTRNALLGLGVADSRVHVITNGVDIRRFRPGPKDPGLIAHYGLAGKRVLMTLARLDERKGHDRVIQALPAILRAQPDTVYVIVGTGEMKERLVKLAREMNISDHVVFTGQIADQAVAEHYRMCDVFIMPNRTLEDGDTEGFGLVFLEAGACARPVIGGNAGGVADAIDHQKTGLLVDGNSVDQIACAAATLIGDCDLCRKMGEAGLQKAASSDWVAKASQFEEIMAHVISRP